jgi:hypothetical protein
LQNLGDASDLTAGVVECIWLAREEIEIIAAPVTQVISRQRRAAG